MNTDNTALVEYDARPVRIDEGLYLGSLKHANDVQMLKNLGITHVLTCIKGVNSWYNGEHAIKHRIIPVNDVETEDFAQHFDTAADFIHHAIHTNNIILVHCQAGISRSTSAIVAYHIKYKSMNVDESLDFIVTRKKDVCPNDGFKRQLHRFHFKHHPTHTLTESNETQSIQDKMRQRIQSIQEHHQSDTKFCKICRAQLFTSNDLVPHVVKKKDFSYKKLKKDSQSKHTDHECSAYFIDRMDWMGQLDGNEGRISCANGHRVGTFVWSGVQCSCGVYVTPAFQILKSRVD
jgi:dual specificity phosphatase 12